MNPNVELAVATCTRGSEDDSLDFPAVLAKLAAVGVEGYYADLRRSLKTYYLPDGETMAT